MHFYFDALNSPLKILELNKWEKKEYTHEDLFTYYDFNTTSCCLEVVMERRHMKLRHHEVVL